MPDKLEIQAPRAECGKCGFSTYLAGRWSVADGRLTWYGEAYLMPFRGPGLDWCSECGAKLEGIEVADTAAGWEPRDLPEQERKALLEADAAAAKEFGL